MIATAILAAASVLTDWTFQQKDAEMTGAGTYRHALVMSEKERDHLHMDGRAYLEFDGILGRSEVWINDVQAGESVVFRPFRLDVTKLLQKGENTVSVRVSPPDRDMFPSETAGIMREVRFCVHPHPHPIPGSLVICIESITNAQAHLIARYMTPWGRETRRWTVKSPRLWTPNDPYRYELDLFGQKFSYGIRTVCFNRSNGLVLNGCGLMINGVVFDSRLGAFGLKEEDSELKRQLLAMKACGVNLICANRVPPSPRLYELCDELGLLICDATSAKPASISLNHPSDLTAAFAAKDVESFVGSFSMWKMEKPRRALLARGAQAIALRITPDPFQPDDPHALRFLRLEAVDANGVPDVRGEREVSCRVLGPGRLVSMGAFDGEGCASVAVRRTGEGAITVEAHADGLQPAVYRLGGIIYVEHSQDAFEIARKAVRAKRREQPNESWTVRLARGEYVRTSTLRFSEEDSGRPGAPVVWQAEGVKIRGGVDVGPWLEIEEGVVSAPIPVDETGSLRSMDMLFVNGRRAVRSVLPKNRGSFTIPGGEDDSRFELVSTNALGAVTYAREYTRLNEDAAAILDAVPDNELADVQMQIRLDWTQARRRVVGWNRVRREVLTEAFGGKSRVSNNRWCKRSAIRFENVRAAFTEPGEWFYDRVNKRVLYRLRAGEEPSSVRAIAPVGRLSKLLVVDGTHDLRFEGFELAYSDAPQGGISDDPRKNNQTYRGQSARTYDAAIHLENARRVEFRKCSVQHTGNYAFRIADGCRDVKLSRCETWDTGAGGVWIGSTEMYPPGGMLTRAVLMPEDPRCCAFNVVEDCRFRHGGRFNPEGTAVFLTHASDCRIEHNEIDDWYYSGITVGYTWGYNGSVAQRNVIAYNRISRLGQRELSDLGGIYTLATSFGTVVRNNVISDVVGYDTAAWGLYADEGSEGIVFENNIIAHTEYGGINQNFGSGCVFRNNIIAYNDARGCLSMSCRKQFGIPSQVHVTGNIFYTRNGPLVCKGAMSVDGVWAHNLWWKEGGTEDDDFDGMSSEEYLASGRAYGDVVADPLFVDAENGNFRLKPDSPALKLGFREWDHSLVGPRPECSIVTCESRKTDGRDE